MKTLMELVVAGNTTEAAGQVEKLLSAGFNPETMVKEALIPAMDEVGALVQKGEYHIPDMLVAAKAMNACMSLLKPALAGGALKPTGKIVIGTVQGDLHDIGKNLVVTIMNGAGLAVIDLGNDVSPDRFVEAIRQEEPDFVGLSALLTTTMLSMKDTIDAIGQAGLRGRVKVMIGGAPVTQEFADQIGADFYAQDVTAGREYTRRIHIMQSERKSSTL